MGVVRKVLGLVAAIATIATLYAPHAFAATGTISGVAFQDTNRNGVQDSGEAPFSGHQLYLYDSTGTYLKAATTAADGSYSFTGIADGTYRVMYAYTSWTAIRDSWAATTSASTDGVESVSLAGTARADFPWRPILRSTDVNAPISTYQGTSGFTVKSYNDVVPAVDLYNAEMGSLVGGEAPTTTLYFDLQSTNFTAGSATQSGTQYVSFSASCYITYTSWMDGRDQTLTHEHGHAWSLYYAYIAQQDPNLTSYLNARGLTGDSRLGTSHAWMPREMIAEDYRQLFGSPNAASAAQENRDIPPAAAVPGLKDFLQNTFTTTTGGSGTGGASTTGTTTPPAFTVSNVTVNPTPVSKSGTVGFQLSLPASTTVQILTANGSLVRSLITNTQEPSGTSSVVWDRKNSAGSRVKSGTYVAMVQATDSYGRTQSASYSFSVS